MGKTELREKKKKGCGCVIKVKGKEKNLLGEEKRARAAESIKKKEKDIRTSKEKGKAYPIPWRRSVKNIMSRGGREKKGFCGKKKKARIPSRTYSQKMKNALQLG